MPARSARPTTATGRSRRPSSGLTSGCPAGPPLRERAGDQHFDLLVGDRPRCPGPRRVGQGVRPALQEPHPPLADGLPRHPGSLRDPRQRGDPGLLRAGQHDPRPLGKGLRRRPLAGQRLQRRALAIRKHQGDKLRAGHAPSPQPGRVGLGPLFGAGLAANLALGRPVSQRTRVRPAHWQQVRLARHPDGHLHGLPAGSPEAVRSRRPVACAGESLPQRVGAVRDPSPRGIIAGFTSHAEAVFPAVRVVAAKLARDGLDAVIEGCHFHGALIMRLRQHG
jgi:hypothetical protein